MQFKFKLLNMDKFILKNNYGNRCKLDKFKIIFHVKIICLILKEP